MKTLISRRGDPLRGHASVPGDKSISHRALIVAALTAGRSRLLGVSDCEDVERTRAALGALGVTIVKNKSDILVNGVGLGGLRPPRTTLDLGNAGTGARLLLGAVAAHDLVVSFTGDESLTRRPMAALLEPLHAMGARSQPMGSTTFPLTLQGTSQTVPITHTMSAPSAQIKSAILLAGLNTMGTTTVHESSRTRDHTEILLRQFGARVHTRLGKNSRQISVAGWHELRPTTITVPGDLSAAAFLLAGALLVPDSDVTVDEVGLNPSRTAFLRVLRRMGARLELTGRRVVNGEARGTVRARFSRLNAVTTPSRDASGLIDEFPILFSLAATARGTSRFCGLAALRTKESDRLSVMARALALNGVNLKASHDTLSITGTSSLSGGMILDPERDHRIAMSLAVAGLTAQRPLRISNAETIATSFPDFAKVMRSLGAAIMVRKEIKS